MCRRSPANKLAVATVNYIFSGLRKSSRHNAQPHQNHLFEPLYSDIIRPFLALFSNYITVVEAGNGNVASLTHSGYNSILSSTLLPNTLNCELKTKGQLCLS